METKRCSRCGEHRPLSDFNRSGGSKDGLHSYCRACVSAYAKARYRGKSEPLPPRECGHCGQSFQPKARNAVYCCPNCKQKALHRRRFPKEGRACEVCGASISHLRFDARWCSESCTNKYRRQFKPEIHRRHLLKKQYGITTDEYDRMLERQGGVCAICGNGAADALRKNLAVDHCHDSGRVRGLLCSNCNIGIGKFKDDPVLLRRAIKYLK